METKSPPPPPPETTHPYAVQVSLQLGNNVELDLSEDEIRLSFGENASIKIVKELSNSREQAISIKRFTVDLEAFSSACEAERAGKMLVFSILWVAASKRVTIAFEKWTGDFPFAIRDRNRSGGTTIRAEGRSYSIVKPEEFSSIAGEVFKIGKDIGAHVLTSMEFFASARMESTERARFIGLMTALEALSVQREYDDDVALLLADLALVLEGSSLLSHQEREPLRNSLSESIKQLRRESVRQAIIRTVKEYISDRDTIRFIDKAYGVRSKILHEGKMTPDLHMITLRIEDIIRQIYSTMLNQSLASPLYPDSLYK